MHCFDENPHLVREGMGEREKAKLADCSHMFC